MMSWLLVTTPPVHFMKDKGLIHQHRTCARCRRSMVLRYRKDRDDVRWRCCGKQCRKEVSVKTGTWFQGYDQPVRILLLFMRAWSEKLTSLAYCKATFDTSAKVALKLNAAMRHVAEEWMLKNPVPVGGPSLTVETWFARRKYSQGWVLPQAWVLGGVCLETGQCFLARVADRSAATLIDVIKENVADGSTVVRDEWRGYNTTVCRMSTANTYV
uniref:ISXO2-like transposase domain-containing protein n=1 Tax=Trichuris muris TaxID=70415 RepID=A0A5S6Q5P4_TRIMR